MMARIEMAVLRLRQFMALSFWRFVLCFAAAGVIIPFTLFLLLQLVIALPFSISWDIFFITLLMMFWPGSFALMALHNEPWYSLIGLLLFAIHLPINALMYSIIGASTWYGLHRRRWILYLTIAVVGYGMYRLSQFK